MSDALSPAEAQRLARRAEKTAAAAERVSRDYAGDPRIQIVGLQRALLQVCRQYRRRAPHDWPAVLALLAKVQAELGADPSEE